MTYILEGLKEAFVLIGNLDPEFLRVSWTSLWITGISVSVSAGLSLPAAFLIETKRFKGKSALVTVLNTLMALPTVVVGLLVYSLLCRKGLFGDLGLLYTPAAMIIGQVILASPIITALTVSSLEGADKRIRKTALTLGATELQSLMMLAHEARGLIASAVLAGFGRIFAEVGVSMMLGGNIRNYTRNITTAIAFETSRGEFALALALGIVLLIFAFSINLLLQLIRKKYV
ncbi:MAG: ABC transporter permease [Candidatus Omnitrophota bacterium]|nr:ABC transporter permease [bacterium]MBU3930653.1 ABC transporter permease [bacterium]